MQPDINLMIRGARRWWYVVVVCPMILAVIAVLITRTQTPLYAASVTMSVNTTSVSTEQSAWNMLQIEEQTAKLYQRVVTLPVVLQAVVERLQLAVSPGALAGQITATTDTSSNLIQVRVSDTDPAQAAAIANEIPVALNSFLASYEGNTTDSSINPLLTDLDSQILSLQVQIATYEAADDQGTPVPVLGFLNDTLDDLTTLRTDLGAVGAGAMSSTVTLLQPAVVPGASYSPSLVTNVAIGVVLGGILAVGAVVVLIYLDSTIKGTVDFQEMIGSPLLSAVAKIPNLVEGRQQLFVIDQPQSEAAEAIRLLRTNIEFASAADEIATLIVSSPASGDGKSTVAANLAVTLSQAGFVTALIDADMRRPEQHHIFQVRNDRGLSTVLTRTDVQWHQAAIETGMPNLVLIPSGPVPPNAADLLSQNRLGDMITDMKRLFDIVIIDTPPVLAVSDALAVAGHADGVVLVCRAGRTRIEAMRKSVDQMRRSAIRMVGVVVNQEKATGKGSYYSSEFEETGGRSGGSPSSLARKIRQVGHLHQATGAQQQA